MNIKEKIAETIRTMWYKQDFQTDDDWLEIAEAIISLTYPCRECGGSGLSNKEQIDRTIGIIMCPICNGTGKGSPMLAVLAENQELPTVTFFGGEHGRIEHDGYELAQKEMIKQGWRKTI